MMELIIFVLLPYTAIVLCAAGIIQRTRSGRLTWSTFSTLLMEQRTLRMGAVAWHIGILLVLAGHLAGLLFPGLFSQWFRNDAVRMWTESLVLAMGMLAFLGWMAVVIRRLFFLPSLFTGPVEWLVMLLLAVQVCSGVYMGLFHRFGVHWYLYTAVPWLRSLLILQPETVSVAGLPVAFKVHVVSAFLLIAALPYTRLVHLLFFPYRYLVDPPIEYRWARGSR